MSKVFVIPDVHLKPWMFQRAEEKLKNEKYDWIVFLGDLVDDWNQQNNLPLYKETFDELIRFITNHPNFLYCYGNHDLSYVWEKRESGYSEYARETVLEGLESVKSILPSNQIAYIHRIDNVLFCHGGLSEMFVSHFLPECKADDIDGLLGMINGLGQNEMWNDISPIWARPQNGYLELYPEDYLQVVGHTPMPQTDFFVNCLTVDNFGTSILGNAKGDQRFVWVDTYKKQWGFVDQNGDIEIPTNLHKDIRNYKRGDRVLFQNRIIRTGEIEYHEGIVAVVDRYPFGKPTIDVECDHVLYKHVNVEDVIELSKAKSRL